MLKKGLVATLAASFAFAATPPAFADEGMWTFDAFPIARANQATGARIDQAWLDRLQRASVRLAGGCSASLVSPEGLVLTNHHCVVSCVQELSTRQRDYVAAGFTTRNRSEERQCPGFQAEVLQTITDITPQIRTAIGAATGQALIQARGAATGAAEQAACGSDETLRCQVISFYRGGQYKLYRYRKYTDVRLAFAPEFQAAFFGGDPDNFNFPRYALDSAFLRVYENGRPATTPDYLRWNPAAPREGDATFVSGNPGSTNRLLTVSQLQTQRDLVIPVGQLQRSELRGRVTRFAEENAEQRRIATDLLFGIENSYKVFYGQQLALNDPTLIASKLRDETELRRRVSRDRRLSREIGDPWREIEAVQPAYQELFLPYRQLETAAGGGSSLYGYARALVRAAQERAKPTGERLPEFSDSRLALLQRSIVEESQVYPELERLQLGFWLSKTREYLTADDPAVRGLLGRESPEGLAQRLVTGSRLGDAAVRRRLYEGGLAAVQRSDDPMIRFALATEGLGRTVRGQWEQRVAGPTDAAAERIARARFATYGTEVYPDATFSLRLSYGRVAGWTYRGRTITPFTRYGGLYERATGQSPFDLPPRFVAAQSRLDPNTVFDFTTTNDIIGGNSGSPVVNANGEVIGAAFDGNIHSLGGAFFFDPAVNRTIVVSTAAITEALTDVYDQPQLVRELMGDRAGPVPARPTRPTRPTRR